MKSKTLIIVLLCVNYILHAQSSVSDEIIEIAMLEINESNLNELKLNDSKKIEEFSEFYISNSVKFNNGILDFYKDHNIILPEEVLGEFQQKYIMNTFLLKSIETNIDYKILEQEYKNAFTQFLTQFKETNEIETIIEPNEIFVKSLKEKYSFEQDIVLFELGNKDFFNDPYFELNIISNVICSIHIDKRYHGKSNKKLRAPEGKYSIVLTRDDDGTKKSKTIEIEDNITVEITF